MALFSAFIVLIVMESQLNATFSDSLPDVDQVFKDFKRALAQSHYETPLRRANRLHVRQGSIALEQKTQGETDQVFNLLPPGHFTRLKVDWWRLLVGLEQSVVLNVPVTVVSQSSGVVLLRNNAAGQVVYRAFPSLESALTVLEAELPKGPASFFPKLAHKIAGRGVTFYKKSADVCTAWAEAAPEPQQVQQFIQTHTKSATLLRVHWQSARKTPTLYILSCSQGKRGGKLPVLSRSSSEACLQSYTGVIRSSANLTVQRSKPIAELEGSIGLCVRLLNSSLSLTQRVSEAVFDFVPDVQRQWVLLACKGYSFVSRKKLLTQVLEPQKPIDVHYLMYPVVARKEEVRAKMLEKNAKSLQKRLSAVGSALKMLKPPSFPHQSASMESSPQFLLKTTLPALVSSPLEHQIITREVGCYEKLVGNSRLHKESQKASIDLVGKYEGIQVWKAALHKSYRALHENAEIADYFEEEIGFEQHFAVVNALLRVLKGDFNFYYKETLRKIHSRFCVRRSHYAVFMLYLNTALGETAISRSDALMALQRFKDLETIICNGALD